MVVGADGRGLEKLLGVGWDEVRFGIDVGVFLVVHYFMERDTFGIIIRRYVKVTVIMLNRKRTK